MLAQPSRQTGPQNEPNLLYDAERLDEASDIPERLIRLRTFAPTSFQAPSHRNLDRGRRCQHARHRSEHDMRTNTSGPKQGNATPEQQQQHQHQKPTWDRPLRSLMCQRPPPAPPSSGEPPWRQTSSALRPGRRAGRPSWETKLRKAIQVTNIMRSLGPVESNTNKNKKTEDSKHNNNTNQHQQPTR